MKFVRLRLSSSASFCSSAFSSGSNRIENGSVLSMHCICTLLRYIAIHENVIGIPTKNCSDHELVNYNALQNASGCAIIGIWSSYGWPFARRTTTNRQGETAERHLPSHIKRNAASAASARRGGRVLTMQPVRCPMSTSFAERFWWCAPDKVRTAPAPKKPKGQRLVRLSNGLRLPLAWYRPPTFSSRMTMAEVKAMDRTYRDWLIQREREAA
jgi:hypothetical protein